MSDKYKLLCSAEFHNNRRLYRVCALKSFYNKTADRFVNEGDVGGFVESEYNLDQQGSSWIFDHARVVDNAKVFEDAAVSERAFLYGDTWLCGNAHIHGLSRVGSLSEICMDADISKTHDVLTISSVGDDNSCITFYRGKDKNIYVHANDFEGICRQARDKSKTIDGSRLAYDEVQGYHKSHNSGVDVHMTGFHETSLDCSFTDFLNKVSKFTDDTFVAYEIKALTQFVLSHFAR